MLILASKSPRRMEILQMMGFNPRQLPADGDETLPPDVSPADAVMTLSERKSAAVFADHPDDVVLGSDTMVLIHGRLLGKPRDKAEAAAMLRALSGNTHTVYTGVCVLSRGLKSLFYRKTDVTFYTLSQREIEGYVNTGDPMDKAGAYGIQGRGAFLARSIRGDFYTVMGLPAGAVQRTLIEHGVFPA